MWQPQTPDDIIFSRNKNKYLYKTRVFIGIGYLFLFFITSMR